MAINKTANDFRDHWTQDAKAIAAANETIHSYGDIYLEAKAIDRLRAPNGYWRDKRSVAIAKAAESTTINQSGRNTTIKAYAQAQETYAYGLDKSSLNLKGNTEKQVSIESKTRITGTWDPAWGIKDSKITSQGGNDVIKINADAGALETSQYRQNQSIKSFGAENSHISTGDGNDTVSITAKSSTSRRFHTWGDMLNGREDASSTHRGRIENVDDRGNGEAVAILNSSIDLGSGNDNIKISANGFKTETYGRDWAGARRIRQAANTFESSIAVKNSSLILGTGDDTIEIKNGNFTNAIFDGGLGLDTLKLWGSKGDNYSLNQVGKDYWLNWNGSTAKLRGIEKLQFKDQSILINRGPVGPGHIQLEQGQEDVQYTIREADLLNGWSDPDGDQISVKDLQVNGSSQGLRDNYNGTWTYTPAKDFNGQINLSYKVSDGKAPTAATANFKLVPVNDAPELTGQQAVLRNGTEDTRQLISEADLLQGYSDVDGDRLFVQNVRYQAGGLQGQLNKDYSGNWVLNPPADYAGRINLSYEVSDGNGGLAYGNNSLNLSAVNDGAGVFQINGRPAIGRTLSVGKITPDPDGDTNSHYSYEWQYSTNEGQSWQNIPNATSASYTFTANDQKKQIRALVNYTDAQGFSEQAATAGVKLPGVTVTGNDFTTGEEDGFDLDGNRNGIQPNTASFVYRLDAAPTYDVVINLAVSDTSEAELSTTRLIFTSQNWNIGQTVVVRGKDDYDNDGNVAYNIIQKIETRDVDYNRLDLANLNLVNLDDAEDKPLYLNPPHQDWIVRGANGNDRIYGGYRQQELRGYHGDDRLYGEQDDDVLIGGGGNDLLDGGSDDDTAVYSGRKDDYIVNRDSNGVYTVRDLRANATDGKDTLKNIERLRFSDQEVAIEDAVTSNYSIRSTLSEANEGERFTTTVQTSNVDVATTLHWDISGTGINASDFAEGALYGSGVIDKDGRFSFSHVLSGDNTTEGLETITISLYSDAARKNRIAQSTVTVKDSSQTPPKAPGPEIWYGNDLNNSYSGGSDNDKLYGRGGNDSLEGLGGNDELYGQEGDDTLYGGDGDDKLYGAENNDKLYGGAGNDILNGGLGADLMVGGAGNDTYYVDDAGDVIDDQGNSDDVDTVIVVNKVSYKLGDVVEDATVNSEAGDSNVTGNKLNNNLTGNDGANKLEGGDGNDKLTGGGGNDVLMGGNGNDTLYAEDGDDKVDAGAGNDLIIGGSGLGDDIYNGGSGTDTLKYTSATAGITVDLLKGKATSTAGKDKAKIGNDTITSVENLIAGYHSDRLTGTNGNNSIRALSGNDWIYGARGNDTINGGSGRDTAQFSSRSNRINLNTTRWQNTGDGKDRLISIENVNAGSGNDKVTGNRASNTLNGQNGNDKLYGRAGNDTLIGGNGRDYLHGGSGRDRLYGGSGNDLLIGGGGKDRLWGQRGRDTFRVQRGGGYAIIEDFTNGQDRIQLGSGRSGLKLKTRGDDVLLYQRGDLMAIVEDAAGDLQLRGNYLV